MSVRLAKCRYRWLDTPAAAAMRDVVVPDPMASDQIHRHFHDLLPALGGCHPPGSRVGLSSLEASAHFRERSESPVGCRSVGFLDVPELSRPYERLDSLAGEKSRSYAGQTRRPLRPRPRSAPLLLRASGRVFRNPRPKRCRSSPRAPDATRFRLMPPASMQSGPPGSPRSRLFR
jgi:hypothetical protein